MDDAAKNAIAPVLGRVPSGLSILVAGDGDGRETGMLASWVQQASFDPPMVTVAVNRTRYLNDWLHPGAPVTINLLAEQDGRFLKHFGKGFEPDVPAFEGLEIDRAENGLPVLSDALGSLEGRVATSMEAGDHLVYAVEITNAVSGKTLETAKPWVHLRKNGLSY